MSKDFNNLKLSIDLLPVSELSQGEGTTQEKFFKIMARQYEDFDFATAQIRFLLDFNKNFGVNLEIVGGILGIRRNGLSDADYKTVLGIFANDLKPGNPGIIRTYKNLMRASAVELQETFPASYLLSATDPNPIISEQLIKDIVQSIIPEGIRLFLIIVGADPFKFDAGSGFGSATEAGGGEFAGIF